MAGIGATQPGVITPNVSQLIGKPEDVVSPSAVSLLGDAFRKGIITSEDIMDRVGSVAQAKNKATIMAAQEYTDPQAVEARKIAQQAANARAKAQERESLAAVQYAPLHEQADKAKTIRAIQNDETLGESEKIAAIFGLAAEPLPKTPEGFVDVNAAKTTASDIRQWSSFLQQTQAVKAGVKFEKRDIVDPSTGQSTGEELAPFSQVHGRFLTPEEYTKVQADANSAQDFQSWRKARQAPATPQPGATPAAPEPLVSPKVAAPSVQPMAPADKVAYAAKLRAMFMNQGILAAGDETDDQVLSRELPRTAITPQVAPQVAKPVVGVVAPVAAAAAPAAAGAALVASKLSPSQVSVVKTPAEPSVRMASEQQKNLAQATMTETQIKDLENTFKALHEKAPGLTGPVVGRLMSIVKPENWNVPYAEFKRAHTSILANMAKGIYHETGVLSDKDIERYGNALPSPKDTLEAGLAKIYGAQSNVFSSIHSNIEAMRGQGIKLNSIMENLDSQALQELQRLSTPSAGASAAVPPADQVFVNPKTGQRMVRVGPGLYRPVQ